MDLRKVGDIKKMRLKVREFFMWAIMGETRNAAVASNCEKSCGRVEEMCCAGFSMREKGKYAFEKHCINKNVAFSNTAMRMGNMKVEIKCYDPDSARYLVVGIAAAISTVVAFIY